MTGERDGEGPVPVRDLMKVQRPAPAPEAEGEPQWEGEDRPFEADGVAWIARPSGSGAYGTGDLGTARVLAIHFFRAEQPETPIREALVPAAVYPYLYERELIAILGRATPIEAEGR